MPTQTIKNSFPSAGQKPATAQHHANSPKKSPTSQEAATLQSILDEPPDMGELLTDSFTPETEAMSLHAELDADPVVGISHASGPSEHQAELDAWVDAGGILDFAN